MGAHGRFPIVVFSWLSKDESYKIVTWDETWIRGKIWSLITIVLFMLNLDI